MKKIRLLLIALLLFAGERANAQVSNALRDTTSYLAGVNFGVFVKKYNFSEVDFSRVSRALIDIDSDNKLEYEPSEIQADFDAYVEKTKHSKSEIKKTSYLLGVNYGSMLKANRFPVLDYKTMEKGYKDYIGGKALKYSSELIDEVFPRAITANASVLSQKNHLAQEEFLAKNKTSYGVKETESGLQYRISRQGNDRRADDTAVVNVNYVLHNLNGDLLDESKEPIELELENVIEGFKEGLKLIGEGGSITLFVPSELGYGETNTPAVEPGSLLIFDIDLISLRNTPAGYGATYTSKPQVFKVTNAEEFLAALGSDRIIEVDSPTPIILTDAIDAWVQAGGLKKVSSYEKEYPNGIFCYDNFDGNALMIVGVKNLTIKAKGKNASLYSRPRYDDVLKFISCEGLTLENLTLGHTDEGYCEDGVLGLYTTSGVTLKNCDLFGCGTEGIIADNCFGLRFNNIIIRDCAYSIMHIKDSKDVQFKNCTFRNNREFDQIGVRDCEDVLFEKCTIKDNQGQLFSINCPVVMRGCTIQHSGEMGSLENIAFSETTINE